MERRPPWHPDSRQRNYGRGFRWQGLDGADAEIEYESDAQAEMAMYDVKDLDAAAVGAQLGVTVLSVEAPEKCGSSCHGGGGDDDNTALIVGGTVGGVAGLAILVSLGWLYFVKGKGRTTQPGASTSPKNGARV